MSPLTETARLPGPELSSPHPPVEERPGPGRKRRRVMIGVGFLLLVTIVPPFINISRFRRSIIRSISAGLGRPVEASAVELELFPLPGFVLHNLSVAEDPAFGAEPVMMAATVTAVLRPSTLWHARVEIATLRFDTPSVNLVRNADGHWNFESLLRHSPALRGRKASAPSRPMPFPYMEATGARINFKFGAEKLPFSLEQANLALWKESNHDWRVRIKARPVRTDLTVEDAGQIRGEGELRTGGMLMNAPVRGTLQWRRVQLGEISRLFRGEDDGWRGTVDWTAHAQGTLSDVAVLSDIGVEEFRRAEFVPASEMDLAAHCTARYARDDRRLDNLSCVAPLGGGQLLMRGQFDEPAVTENAGSLRIALRRAPAGFFLELLNHIHPGVAESASASGLVTGRANCDWPNWDTLQDCTGEFRSTNLRLNLPHIDQPLTLSPLLASSPDSVEGSTGWRLLPLRISLGGTSSAVITGRINSGGSTLRIDGAADLTKLGKLARALRIPAISGEVQSIRGGAQLALSFESTWLPHSGENEAQAAESSSTGEPSPSVWTGSLEVHDATLKLAALPLPVQLASGRVNLRPDGVEWARLNGTFGHTPFDGSIRWQTACPTAVSTCARRFALHTSNLNASRLEAALRGESPGLLGLIQPWTAPSPGIPDVSGTLDADNFSVGRISLTNATLALRLQGQRADLLAISGNIFGGKLSGGEKDAADGSIPEAAGQREAGSLQWGDGAPAYALRAKLTHIQPDSAAEIWNEHWGRGTAGLQINLKTDGWSAAELARNATGKFSVEWINGALVSRDGGSPETPAGFNQFQSWKGTGTIGDRQLVVDTGRMIPRDISHLPGHIRKPEAAEQSVTGRITFGRMLDLKFQPSGVTMTGPLSSPMETPGNSSPAAEPQ